MTTRAEKLAVLADDAEELGLLVGRDDRVVDSRRGGKDHGLGGTQVGAGLQSIARLGSLM